MTASQLPTGQRVPVARDIMQRSLITLSPDDSFFDAIRTFMKHRISGAPVIDSAGRLVGICSERDCLEVLANGEYWRDDPGERGTVGSMMRTRFESVPPHTDIYALAQRFVSHNVRRLPVIENGELIGQLSRRDVLHAMEAFGVQRCTRRRYPDYRKPSVHVGARRSS